MTMSNGKRKKIFLLDDDVAFCSQMEYLLADIADVDSFYNYNDFLNAVENARPDLALIDLNLNDPYHNGFDVIMEIKKKKDAHLLPMIMISGADSSEILHKAFRSGIEDYVQKPIIPDIFISKIENVLYMYFQKIHMNPLTGLPGNRIIEEEFYLRMNSGKQFSVAYLDMDNFKPFNDIKGVKKGDKAIQLLAFELLDRRNDYTREQLFVGHLGGDDFFLMGNKSKIREMINSVYESFSAKMKSLFTKEEVRQNYYISEDRSGVERKFPLLTVSASLVHIGAIMELDFETLTEFTSRLKKSAKKIEGFSIYEHTLLYPPGKSRENNLFMEENRNPQPKGNSSTNSG